MMFGWQGPTLRSEIIRNLSGFALLLFGLVAIGIGCHGGSNWNKMTEAGAALVSSSLLAFQIRRTPTDDPNQAKPNNSVNVNNS